MSFTEFTYQLVQGYDFLHLFKEKNCTLQMGGSDQWGNITTGTELIRRIAGEKAFAITCPLITKADGTKFGKSEGGNVWLDRKKTSPYKFYQYWINSSDEDVKAFIRIFTLLDQATIEGLEKEHEAAPHARVLQKRLAEEITCMVHSRADYEAALAASGILHGKSSLEELNKIDEETFLSVFEGVPQFEMERSEVKSGVGVIDALSAKTGFLKSNGEARRALKANSISVNKQKVTEEKTITEDDLINDRFVLLQSGKKNYFIIKVIGS